MPSRHIVAPAKVNLFLHVLGRRADGYHDLQSLVVFTKFGDELAFSVTEAEGFAGSASGSALAGVDAAELDSIERAATLLYMLQEAPRRGFHRTLDKRIPIAAGLGGGSADAAATLRILNDLWQTRLSEARLEALGARIGADVPVCLRARSTIVSGIGEVLHDAPAMPAMHLVLAHTGKALPTKRVFQTLERTEWSKPAALPASFGSQEALTLFLRGTRNDLTTPALRLQPQIGALLADIAHQPGCMLARMSGSGAACFGLFASEIEAFAGAEGLRQRGWWAVATISPANQ